MIPSEFDAFVTISDSNLETRLIRVPGAENTIVLLHEALGSVSHWRDFPALLAERGRMDVLVYSRRGHGQSDGPPLPRNRRYFEQQALEVLPAVLAHFSVDAPILLGHSEGAAMALIYAAHHPASVRALVLESPILCPEPAAAQGMALAERAWRETDLRQKLARHHRDPDAVFAAWLSIRRSDSLLAMPLAAQLPAIHCPVLVLQGDRDEYATSLQTGALRPLAPQMQLVLLADTGHTPHRERMDAVIDRIRAFLDLDEIHGNRQSK